MIEKQLASDRIQKISNIIHIADVHIRNFKRHDEYQIVFDRLYEYCRDQVTKEPNTILYLAGDIVHAKTDLSPELVEMTRNFFVELSLIAPVVLISGNHDCYTPDHEVLTINGWVGIKEYVESKSVVPIATFNVISNTAEFQVPTEYIDNNYSGKLYCLSGSDADLCITPTHEILHTYSATKTWYKKYAKDIKKNTLIPINAAFDSDERDDFYKLLGFAFADGTFVLNKKDSDKFRNSRCQFHIKNEREISFLSDLLTKMNYKFNSRLGKDGAYTICIYSKLGRDLCEYFEGKKEIPIKLLSEDLVKIRSFIDGYLMGDGSKRRDKDSFWSFSSISENSIDILYTAIRLVGGTSHRSDSIVYGKYENSKQQYLANTNLNNRVNNTSIIDIKTIDYDGNVYCVTVPNSNIFIRRNGKICISGNCNLNNRSRMDALSPIVNTIDANDFHYLEESGIYTFCNVDFVLNSVYDDPEDFIKSEDVSGTNTKIVLYHGTIDRAKTDIGIDMKNSRVPIEKFDGFDFGMFGDIHRFQYLDTKGRFAYAGSLIQQNFGEGIRHGIINWNVETGKSKFVQIKNDWEFHTIDIKDGTIDSVPAEFAPRNRVRLRSYDTSNGDLSKAIAKLKAVIPIEDLRIQKISTKHANANVDEEKIINIGDLRDPEYQNEIIVKYLEEKHSVLDDDMLDEVRKINRKINTSIGHNTSMRNIIWTPIKFEFENMFSYGEDNVIDFSSMAGTYGMFAANASGKSSAIDALLFCIFDKCSKTFKATKVLNTQKDSFRCKLQFQIAGTDYFIERVGVKDKKGHVKVNVDFWYEKDGIITSLNGDDRDGTNFIIRDYLGTYDDFIITAVSLQNNNTNFVDTDQRDRKDLLAQFLDLDVFEELNTVAMDEFKSVKTLIKDIEKQDYPTKMADANTKNKVYKEQLADKIIEKEELQSEAENKTNQIIELTKKLKQTDFDFNGLTLNDLNLKKEELQEELDKLAHAKNDIMSKHDAILLDVTLLEEEFNAIDKEELFKAKSISDKLKKEISELKTNLREVELSIDHNQSKIDKLKTHEYDPNCKYCINNVFVVDANQAKEQIELLYIEKSLLTDEIHNKTSELDELNFDENSIDSYRAKESDILNKRKLLNASDHASNINNNQIDIANSKLNKVIDTIDKYELNQTAIEENKLIHDEISKTELIRDTIITNLRNAESEIVTITSNIKVNEKIISDCADGINKIRELEMEHNAYNFYLKAVNRNGVPYEMISNALPKIQTEVNNILSQIVEFQVLFETDGKSINAHIVYDENRSWDLELTSGMEKFVSSLAIRTALINVSSLPRPNFIVIDEGLGALDASTLSNFSVFLEYMKTEFDFLILVSHIDTVKDIVDAQIEIKKENGISTIQF